MGQEQKICSNLKKWHDCSWDLCGLSEKGGSLPKRLLSEIFFLISILSFLNTFKKLSLVDAISADLSWKYGSARFVQVNNFQLRFHWAKPWLSCDASDITPLNVSLACKSTTILRATSNGEVCKPNVLLKFILPGAACISFEWTVKTLYDYFFGVMMIIFARVHILFFFFGNVMRINPLFSMLKDYYNNNFLSKVWQIAINSQRKWISKAKSLVLILVWFSF